MDVLMSKTLLGKVLLLASLPWVAADASEAAKQQLAVDKLVTEVALSAQNEPTLKESVLVYLEAAEKWRDQENFEKALQALQQALALVERQQDPILWAQIQNDIGGIAQVLMNLNGIKGAVNYFEQATEAYQTALEIYTPEQNLSAWVETQTGLSTVWQDFSERLEDDSAVQLLKQAEAGHRAVLAVINLQDFPQDWAIAQYNLGLCLHGQAEYLSKEDAQPLLTQAVAAYQTALQVFTRKDWAMDWADTQTNLAGALLLLGENGTPQRRARWLAQAVAAYQAALTVNTREANPETWATLQFHLGNALDEQGNALGGEAGQQSFMQAAEAYQAALAELKPEQNLQSWSDAQYNLGLTYLALEQWDNAAQSFAHVCNTQRLAEACYLAYGTYHEYVFDYEAAFSIAQDWLAEHPDDVEVAMDFAEHHVTTGRFVEAQQRLQTWLKPASGDEQNLESDVHVALSLLNIIAALGLQDAPAVEQAKQDLIAYLESTQPLPKIEDPWVFSGVLHFLQQRPEFAQATWLMSALKQAEQGDWAGVLSALQKTPQAAD